jgi:uncharacterized membrane protein
MDLRLALLELAAHHELTPAAAAQLNKLAFADAEPRQLARIVLWGMAILGAALGGLGIIFWVAANWGGLTRGGQFALLQSVTVAMSAGALLRPSARVPLGILALLSIGGLFAFFGQTYQTGSDAWQLFALWAALTLPLCLGVRHDALWAPWTLVAMTGISLWIHGHSGYALRVDAAAFPVHLAGWGMAMLLTFSLAPNAARYSGAGLVAMRTALVLACIIVTVTAAIGLFYDRSALYLLGLLTLGAAAALFSERRFFDIFALSTVGLGLNVLLLAGTADFVLRNSHSNLVLPLLIVAVVAALLLGSTVQQIMQLSRRHASLGAQA